MATNKLTMQKAQVYIQAFIETSILGWITLADIDSYVRVTTGLIGIVLACFTGYKIWQRIKQNAVELETKKLELMMKQEEVRRYFESKYNDTNRSSKEIPESSGTTEQHIQG